MIQIDDAGNGAVLGGEVIGALRVETGEYICEVLPLTAYAFFEIPRVYAAKAAVLNLLDQLNPGNTEEILICTGDIFKAAKTYLTEHGINWREEKITGTLQELVEASFFNSLRAYGLPERFRAFHRDYPRFHNRVFNWVCQDLARRAKYCKPLRLNSGRVARAKIYKTMPQKACTCALCQLPISPAGEAVIDKHEEQPQYFHPECFPSAVDLCDYQESTLRGQTMRCFINTAQSLPICPICQEKIKYKKRLIRFQDQLYHYNCLARRLAEAF